MTRNRLTARHYDIGREAFKKKSAVAPSTHSATSAAAAGEVPPRKPPRWRNKRNYTTKIKNNKKSNNIHGSFIRKIFW